MDNLHYEKFADGGVKCIEDEIPFEVPEGWTWCHYSDVIELYSGQDLTSDRYNDIGNGIPYITGASNLEHGKIIINRWTTTPTTHATIDDLLLTVKGSGVGKMAFCDITDAHIARQIMALRCKTIITPQYLHIAISAMLSEITAQANGIIPGIRREIVLGAYLPLPPISEQNKICEIVDRLLHIIDAIDNDKDELQNIIQIAKSKILDLAIRGKLVPQNPDDEPASVLLERIRAEKEELIKQGNLKRNKKDSVIFKGDDNSYYENLPNGWNICALGEVSEIITGGTPNKSNSEYYGGSFPFFKPADLDQKKKMIVASEYLSELGKRVSRIIPENSILICCIGTVGKCGYTKRECSTNQQINAIIPYIDSEYLFYYCHTNIFQKELNNRASATTIAIVNKSKTAEVPIVVPPLSEQKRIVEVIETLFAQIDKIAEQIS